MDRQVLALPHFDPPTRVSFAYVFPHKMSHAANGDLMVQVNLSGSTWTDVAIIHDTGPILSAGNDIIQMMLDATQTAVHV